MPALMDLSDMLVSTQSQCLSISSHICYFEQESATTTKIHMWKLTVGL